MPALYHIEATHETGPWPAWSAIAEGVPEREARAIARKASARYAQVRLLECRESEGLVEAIKIAAPLVEAPGALQARTPDGVVTIDREELVDAVAIGWTCQDIALEWGVRLEVAWDLVSQCRRAA